MGGPVGGCPWGCTPAASRRHRIWPVGHLIRPLGHLIWPSWNKEATTKLDLSKGGEAGARRTRGSRSVVAQWRGEEVEEGGNHEVGEQSTAQRGGDEVVAEMRGSGGDEKEVEETK